MNIESWQKGRAGLLSFFTRLKIQASGFMAYRIGMNINIQPKKTAIVKPSTSLSLQRGQAVIGAVVFFLALLSVSLASITTPVLSDVTTARALHQSGQSLYLSEAGIEDAVYRILNAMDISASETITLNGSTAVTTIDDISASEKQVRATGNVISYIRTTRSTLTTGTGVAFFYGIQTGEGGLLLENTSRVSGNAYSNGPIDGAGSNLIAGDAVSAGASGLVRDVHLTGSGYAHTITNADIDTDAYYQSISASTVGGVSYPGSLDQETGTLPISDETVAEWEASAAAGGTISSPCPYVIDSNVSLGPVKINCSLEIEGTPTVTLGGPVWVVGNITIKNSPSIRVAAALGEQSVAFIADNPANRLTSSMVDLQNSALFFGSGAGNSYVLMLSANESAEQGGGEEAITVRNTVAGDLLVYSGHGEIALENSIDVKEVTAYRVRLKNSAEVIYETGLASALFSSGPGGGWNLQGWGEE